MSRVTERLTFANVMSVVAVFIAIGGGAYAAGLAKNSVKSKQIAANAVKKPELARNAVITEKIANSAVTGDKIADGSVTGAKVDEASLSQVPLALVATKATNTLGAVVAQGGELSSAAQSGTSSAHVGVPNSGQYTVDFGRSLSNCAAVAALGNNVQNIPNAGEIGATLNFDDTVTVQTRDSAGAPKDNGFELIVVC